MSTDTAIIDVSHDWITACDIQERFMRRPGDAMDVLDCGARCRQVRALGGDCYDFLPLSSGRLALAVGDASGKGLPAALMISNVQSSLRTAASFIGDDGPAVLGAVNRQVHASSLADRYATLFYGVFDGASRMLRYVNAGHNPPMIVRRGTVGWLDAGGLPVGIFAESTYEEGCVRLSPGDILVAYTDGVVEARNRADEDWGVAGLQRAVLENRERDANGLVDAILASLDEFSGGLLTDDATVVVIRVR